MDVVVIAGLIVLGILLLMAEVFLIPGTSISGYAAAACLIAANFYAFSVLGSLPGLITLAVSVFSVLGVVVWFMHSKSLDKLALKKDIDSTVRTKGQQSVKVGDHGVATTRLALIGNAQINGYIVEVKSANDFIEEKTPVEIIRIDEGIIVVDKMK